MDSTPISVSDAITLVNQSLDYAFPTLVVEGEVAGFKVNQNKFVFFDLKDETGTLGCFMMVYALKTALEDGMRVRVVASPKLTDWGKFSLTVKDVRPVGEGSLRRAFDLLHARLAREGLFAPERKRMLPKIPQNVGVISSVEAAGYKDFVKVLSDRLGGIQLTVLPTQVQGASAAEQMTQALAWFNQQAEPVEVVVLVRGGGSADDLSAFNDEQLVRAIATSRIPTLVGVGHEVDVTLADLAADVRASTPTNAAQLLVPDRRDLASDVSHRLRSVVARIEHRIATERAVVDAAPQQVSSVLERRFLELQQRFIHQQRSVTQLNPQNILQRGYALVFAANHHTLGAARPQLGDYLRVETARYSIKTEVKHVKDKETE